MILNDTFLFLPPAFDFDLTIDQTLLDLVKSNINLSGDKAMGFGMVTNICPMEASFTDTRQKSWNSTFSNKSYVKLSVQFLKIIHR